MKRGEFPRFPEAIVFKTKGVRITAVMKLIIAEVLARAEKFEGQPRCTPVFHFLHEGGAWMYYPCIGRSIPHDPAALDQILLEMEELESVRHHRNFKPGEKIIRPRKSKPKPKSEGPFTEAGHDLSKIRPQFHFFYEPEMDEEGLAMAKLLKGYPFTDRTPIENSRYIEMELTNRLRDRFPHIYELNKLLDGAVVEALKLIAKPELQQHVEPGHLNISRCFSKFCLPNTIDVCRNNLRDWDYLIKTGKLQGFRKRKGKGMPDPEEASEDKLFMSYGGGRRAVNDACPSDPELEYDESC